MGPYSTEIKSLFSTLSRIHHRFCPTIRISLVSSPVGNSTESKEVAYAAALSFHKLQNPLNVYIKIILLYPPALSFRPFLVVKNFFCILHLSYQAHCLDVDMRIILCFISEIIFYLADKRWCSKTGELNCRAYFQICQLLLQALKKRPDTRSSYSTPRPTNFFATISAIYKYFFNMCSLSILTLIFPVLFKKLIFT